ncbi:hypothetical protein D8B22_19935 [Verminephrobacter aporrectodeae subsp. tuberculatae]|nr:hypothetical protein [Verminephrobacter aporrectodeae subsp. tuberculatae]MCW8171310.1 hypothetical protein [Verminephrobacter aporrectodeae subsp. tuberculatae]
MSIMKLETLIKQSQSLIRGGIKITGFSLLVVIGAYIFEVFWLAKLACVVAGYEVLSTLPDYWIFRQIIFSVHLSMLEKTIFDAVREKLQPREAELWDKQVAAINKIAIDPGESEVNFFVMRDGKPDFPSELCFKKRRKIKIANFDIDADTGAAKLRGCVWCMKGYVFSIEYRSKISEFERAAQGQWHVVRCHIVNYPA